MADTKSLFDIAMSVKPTDAPNPRQAVPFFHVKDMQASLRCSVDGLRFAMTRCSGQRTWNPENRIRWCWLQRGDVAIMLQQYWRDGKPGLARRPSR